MDSSFLFCIFISLSLTNYVAGPVLRIKTKIFMMASQQNLAPTNFRSQSNIRPFPNLITVLFQFLNFYKFLSTSQIQFSLPGSFDTYSTFSILFLHLSDLTSFLYTPIMFLFRTLIAMVIIACVLLHRLEIHEGTIQFVCFTIVSPGLSTVSGLL